MSISMRRRIALIIWWVGALFAFAVMTLTMVTWSAGGDLGGFGLRALVVIGVITLPLWLITYFMTGYFLIPPPRPFGKSKH